MHWQSPHSLQGELLEKFPDLKIYVSHGGGTISTLLPRLNYGWETMEEIRKHMPAAAKNIMQKKSITIHWFMTLNAFNYLFDIVGPSQLMIGSDYPFAIREKFPGHWLDDLEINQEDKGSY